LGRRVLIRASRFIGGGSTDLSCFALLCFDFLHSHLISQHNSKRQKRKFKVDSTPQFDKTSKASTFALDFILFGVWLNCCVMSSRPASLNDLMMSQLRQPAVWHVIGRARRTCQLMEEMQTGDVLVVVYGHKAKRRRRRRRRDKSRVFLF
jgi:hypothetical protein